MKIFFLCLFVASALGQSSKNDDSFKSVDSNGDGVVVFDELLSDFLEKDTNGDRRVSREEFAAKSSAPFFLEGTFNYYDKLDGEKDGIMEEISVTITYNILDPEHDGEISRDDFEKNVGQIEIGIISEMMALFQQQPSPL